MAQISYLFFLKEMLNIKKRMASNIPIPANVVIPMYKGNGIDISSNVTYVESRGMLPSVK